MTITRALLWPDGRSQSRGEKGALDASSPELGRARALAPGHRLEAPDRHGACHPLVDGRGDGRGAGRDPGTGTVISGGAR